MANFETLKTAIDANINTNGKQAITGSVVNNVMHQMVDATSEQLTELESQGGYTLMTETERQDGAALTIKGVIESHAYVNVGTIFTYALQKNRIYQIEVYAPPFSANYAVVCLYKNGNFVKYLGRCNSDNHKEHITIDTQYLDVDTIKVCSYNQQGYLEKYHAWESSSINRDDVPLSSVKGVNEYKILEVPTIEDSAAKSKGIIDSLTNNTLSVPYVLEKGKAYTSAEIGSIIGFTSSNYRDLIIVDVRGLQGILEITNTLSLGSWNVGIILVDDKGTILANTIVDSVDNQRSSFINLELYPNAVKAYSVASNNPSAKPFAVSLLTKGTLLTEQNAVFSAVNAVNGGIRNLRHLQYLYQVPDVATIGQPYNLVYNQYRAMFLIPVTEVAGYTIKIEKVNPINSQGVLIVNNLNEVIGIISATPEIQNTLEIDLNNYPNAEYLIFAASPGESYAPIFNVIEKGGLQFLPEDVNGIEKKTLSYTSQNYMRPDASLNVGDNFATTETPYRSVAEVNVLGLRGKVNITNILGDSNEKAVFVVDSNNIILDILSNSASPGYVHEVVVNLEKYSKMAAKVYIEAAPTTADNYSQPTITNWYDGIKERVSDLESIMPKGGVVILHFDVNPYANKKAFEILAEYGFPASWALEDSAFGDGTDNTFSTWRSEEYKKAFWSALKRGDDVGIYPSEIASRYDEDGWKNWLDVALNNLANHGIHNVSSFFCGRLDINDDLLNAVKSRGFKFIRGRGAGDSQSVDTYPYTEKNAYMPIKATHETFFVNSTFFIGAGTNVDKFEGYVNKAIDNNAAISVFTHVIEENENSPVNITEAKFRAIMDVFKEKVDAGKLQLMTWREYYRCINRLKGEEWDYNRLLKMSMPKDL